MLDPNDRQHLYAALAPPAGYRLDHAIGTTFTLDLMAAMTVPLAFSLFGGETDDPLALLQALQTNAEKVTLFCQIGRISVPARYQMLFGYLEPRIVQVRAPHPHGVFHPKVWVLRYVAGEDKPVRYRLLVASRNLTFDRSWDTLLCLDGELLERKRGFGKNRPISDFIAKLPELATQSVPDHNRIAQIADELRRVQFVLPTGFDDYDFHTIGLTRRPSWPFAGQLGSRLLVISPFLAIPMLGRLARLATTETTLITRLVEAQKLSATQLAAFDTVWVLDDSAEIDDDTQHSLTGLHAKLFLLEHGWNATLWTGSANASNAAFDRNVEFLVALHGKKSKIGIKKLLPTDDEAGFGKLLQPFTSSEPEESLHEALEMWLEIAQRRIVAAEWRAWVDDGEDGLWQLSLNCLESVTLTKKFTVTGHVRPISLPNAAHPFATNLCWSSMSFAALTSFFAFTLTIELDGERLQRHFVLNVPLENAPAGRHDHIVQHLLSDANAVLRYLRLLLADSPLALLSTEEWTISEQIGDGQRGLLASSELFESLVKALARQPERLPAIARIIDILRDTPERLPDGLLSIWEPIWQAYCEIYDTEKNVKRKT